MGLAETIAQELESPQPEPIQAFVAAIRRRHGDAVAAILFYGSCLRRGCLEGVLDFYVLVDSYRAAYRSRWMAALNAALPPNVLYLEIAQEDARLRAKYAVITTSDFARGASLGSFDSRVWARFCQPAALVYERDPEARRAARDAAARATLTMVARMRTRLPAEDGVQRFSAADFWSTAFRETYRAELRSERPEVISTLFAAAPERYQRVLDEALAELERQGDLRARFDAERFRVELDPRSRLPGPLDWRIRRPIAKTLAILGLLKSAWTFGDWVPYVVWKLERHGGAPIELSERQRRHPLLWGWPVLFRLLRRRILR